MIRVIHLSDLHIHKVADKADNQNAYALVEQLIARYAKAPGRTYVALTGDLVDDSQPEQYKKLKGKVLEPLRNHFKVICVPGNHDYAFSGIQLNPQGPANYDKYVGKPVGEFPEITKDEQEQVVFFGLDSADAKGDELLARGTVDDGQLGRLIQAIEQYRDWFQVVLVHHHPFHRNLTTAFVNADKFRREAGEKVDLVLFGHKHMHEAFFGKFLVAHWLAAGKVTEACGEALMYRVIEIDRATGARFYTDEVKAADER